MELRVNIDTDYMEDLKKQVNETKNTAIISEALALYKWAASQKKAGKNIFSSDDKGQQVEQIILPGLDKIK